jgi:superoxide reductase
MLKFYQCEQCGKVIISKDELHLPALKEIIPSSTDAAVEKHVPVVTKKCKQVQVNVGSVTHPMSEEHFIGWIALETEKGYQVQYLSANEAPMAAFTLANGDKVVAVYAYCNLHGIWKN